MLFIYMYYFCFKMYFIHFIVLILQQMFTCINVYWAIMADLRGSMTFTPVAEHLTRLGSVAVKTPIPASRMRGKRFTN